MPLTHPCSHGHDRTRNGCACPSPSTFAARRLDRPHSATQPHVHSARYVDGSAHRRTVTSCTARQLCVLVERLKQIIQGTHSTLRERPATGVNNRLPVTAFLRNLRPLPLSFSHESPPNADDSHDTSASQSRMHRCDPSCPAGKLQPRTWFHVSSPHRKRRHDEHSPGR